MRLRGRKLNILILEGTGAGGEEKRKAKPRVDGGPHEIVGTLSGEE